MIEIIEGRGVGAGKSYFVLERLLRHWRLGGTACVSDSVMVKWDATKDLVKKRYGLLLEDSQYRVIKYDDLTRLHEVTPAGTEEMPVLLVIDEAQQAFNARDWADKCKRAFFDWLCHSRHDCNDVVVISQASANVDKQVRRLATFFWVVRNSEFFPLLGLSVQTWCRIFTLGLFHGRFFIRTQLDQDGRTKLDRKWVFADVGIYGCYNSLSMRLKHRRAAEVAKLQLRKDKRGLSMKGLILVSLIVAIFSGCALYRYAAGRSGGGKGVESKRVEVVAGGKAQRTYVNGDILREAFRASMPGYLVTAVRVYRLGVRNDLGFVVGMKTDSALVEVAQGVRVLVQTFEEKDVGPERPTLRNTEVGTPFGVVNQVPKNER